MTTLIAHEWLSTVGGSESVFEQLLQVFPDVRATCLWNDAPGRFGREIEETWLARTPLRRSKPLAMPFLSRVWTSVDLRDVDRVIASSHAFAHHLAGLAAEAGIQSFAYVHSPARYVWAPEHDGRGQSLAARLGRNYFKRLDSKRTSRRVAYACNSGFVARRIREAWDVDAEVIHPPVDVDRIRSVHDWRTEIHDSSERDRVDALPPQFVLGASRLVEYKRVDAAIETGEALGLPVVIAGRGPDLPRLRVIAETASVPVTFFGYASDAALYALYQAAELFVFMAVEDFGIMPVEAVASGTPVLLNRQGGAAEIVRSIGGGAVADPDDKQEMSSLAESLLTAEMAEPRAKSVAFSTLSFRERIRAWVRDAS